MLMVDILGKGTPLSRRATTSSGLHRYCSTILWDSVVDSRCCERYLANLS